MKTQSKVKENKVKISRVLRGFIIAAFLFYVLILLFLLFFSHSRQFRPAIDMSLAEYLHRNMNLIPFKTIENYIMAYFNGALNKSIVIENLAGNILAFAPMGIFLPFIFRGFRTFNKFFLAMFVMLIAIEVTQLATHTGSCDIDDVILNLAGAVLVYGIWSLSFMQKLLKKIHIIESNTESIEKVTNISERTEKATNQ